MKKHQMTIALKMAAAMLALALAVSLAGCASSGSSSGGNSLPETAQDRDSGSADSGSSYVDRGTDAGTETESAGRSEGNAEEQTEDAQSESAADDQEDETGIPAEAAGHYSFASGAGGWSTELELLSDGSFIGEFHDSDMGDTGDGYPMGTVYTCVFSGTFSDVEQIGGGLYSMTLTGLTQETVENEETIENDVRFIGSYPYGICSYEDRDVVGNTYYLYAPGYPTDGLSESFLMWAGAAYWEEGTDSLPFWCLSTGALSSGDEYVFISIGE